MRKVWKKAATGWAIVAMEQGKAWVLGRGGTKVEATSSGSFGVEAFALEELVNELLGLCNNQGVCDDSWIIEPITFVQEWLVTINRS